MSIKQGRDKFEQEYADYCGLPVEEIRGFRMASNGSYRLPQISKAWHWFQAGQQSVVVEIPMLKPNPECSAADARWNEAMLLCCMQVEAAGGRVQG